MKYVKFDTHRLISCVEAKSNDNHVKENSNNDCVVNVKNLRISNELGQNLSGWQIYPST